MAERNARSNLPEYQNTGQPLATFAALVSMLGIFFGITACKKQAVLPTNPPVHVASGPQDPDLTVKAAGYRGRSFSGPMYIPRTSPVEDGTTLYSVVYQHGVNVISKETTVRDLVAIHPDGGFVFRPSAKQIAQLKPGSIVLLSGLALRTVVAVQKRSDGFLLKTAPAKITDAIRSGRLEGTYRIDFSQMQKKAPEGAEFDVNFSGYNYHVKFTPATDRINVHATIKFGGSQGVLAYEGDGYLGNFASTIRMQLKNGEVTNLDFINSDIAGQINLKWYAAATDSMKAGTAPKITSWPAELLKNPALSRAAYHLPIVLGDVPFDLRLSLGFSFISDFTSKNSVIEGGKLVQYRGNGGFSLLNGQTHPSGSFTVDGTVTDHDDRVVSAGPVGFTAATEAPRLELAMGWPPSPTPAVAYLNFVTSYGIVTNGQASQVPCQTNIMAFSVNAGDAYTSPDSFAKWSTTPVGSSPSVSLWAKTAKSASAHGRVCPG
jgi:hypothetical protein